MIDVGSIETLFNDLFGSTYNTRLCRGAEEPVYYPEGKHESYARIFYRNDYIASALHEVAHWTIAGPQRRQEVDYGYWYTSDERNAMQQQAFFTVEVKPQALEAIFSESIGLNFNVSLDNINAQKTDELSQEKFIKNVAQQKKLFLKKMPERADQFNQSLINFINNKLEK